MKQPPLRISIVILVYNVAPYLVECLDSVRAQTYPDWEALCVDDGSTDASSILLDTYARLDPRIHVIHQRNAGVSSARNRALDTAHGEWICFVDGDDAIHPQALERLARALGKAPSVQAVVFERLSGEVLPRQWNLEDAAPQVERQHSEAMLRRFEPSVWRVLFRRDCIGALRFPAYVIGEDGLFSLQYYLRTSMWLVVEWSLYFYRARQSSVMHTEPSVRFVRDWLDCFYERVCLFARDYVISDGGGRDLFGRHSRQGVVYAGRHALCLAVCYRPRSVAALAALGPDNQCCSSLSPSSATAALFHRRKSFLSPRALVYSWALSRVECVVRSLPAPAVDDTRSAQPLNLFNTHLIPPSFDGRAA